MSIRILNLSFTALGLLISGCGSGANDRRWDDVEQISFMTTQSAQSPRVASAGNGNALIAWQRLDIAIGAAFVDVTRHTKGDGWDDPITLGTPEYFVAGYPRLAASETGSGAILYAEPASSDGNEMSAHWYDPDAGWAPIAAPPYAGDFNEPDAIAFDAGHTLHAMWQELDSSAGLNSMFASRYTPDVGWSAAVSISDGGAGESITDTELAVDTNGLAVAIWTQGDSGSRAVYSNRYAPADGWGEPERISSLPGSARQPTIVIGPGGEATAAWVQADETGRATIRTADYASDSGWGADTGLGSAFDSIRGPAIAIDGDGNTYLAWSRRRDLTMSTELTVDVVAATRSAGGEWADSMEIDEQEFAARAPDIVGLPDGGALVVWRQATIESYEIAARRFRETSAWQAIETLGASSTPPGDDISPQINIDAKGIATVAWPNATADGGHVVFAARYR